MREFDRKLLDKHGKKRFESEYDYAMYEYYRSPKLLKEIESENINNARKVLDNGCGSGGVVVSFAEEFDYVVGLDIEPRYEGAGIEIAKKKKIKNLAFLQGDGCCLPFRDDTFDLVVSHSVIEHTFDPQRYVDEIYRVLKPGGILFLETPPYFSFEGSHLPRLKKPVPLQLFLPRKMLFKFMLFIAKRKPQWIKGGLRGSAMLTDYVEGREVKIEHLQKMTITRLRRIIRKSDFSVKTEKLYHPSFFDKLPRFFVAVLRKTPFIRSFVINTYKVFLIKAEKQN